MKPIFEVKAMTITYVLYQPLNFKYVQQDLIQRELIINYVQLNNLNSTWHNLINNINKHYINNKNKIINSFANKHKTNNAIIVSAEK